MLEKNKETARRFVFGMRLCIVDNGGLLRRPRQRGGARRTGDLRRSRRHARHARGAL